MQEELFYSADSNSYATTSTVIDALSWKDVLYTERQSDYFKNILTEIEKERAAGIIVYPPNKDIFNALSFTEFSNVKVVILGQDPYHGPGQAYGLCFSVRPGVNPPPSLKNIYKELYTDLGISIPKHGCLETWSKQGVLLLNSVLSVRAGQPNSHAHLGWEIFTDRIIAEINQKLKNVVFMLWGQKAQNKCAKIDCSKHLILTAAHPSPFSAHSGFFGCKHFSKANDYLQQHSQTPINWSIS